MTRMTVFFILYTCCKAYYFVENTVGAVEVKAEAQDFSSPLSTLSEIWQPKVKESDPPQPCDLAELFSKLGLGKYTDLFQQQEVGSHCLFLSSEFCLSSDLCFVQKLKPLCKTIFWLFVHHYTT